MAKKTNIWKNISTINELCECTIKFIKGELSETPYHLGPLNKDSAKLSTQLIELNNLGFITTNGQGGLINEGFCEKTWIDYEGKKCGNWFYCIHQKPYVDGFIKTETANKIIDMINNDKPFIKYIVTFSNKIIRNCEFMWVTKSKTFYDKKDEDTSIWKPFTHEAEYENLNDAINDHHFNKKINKILTNNYCHMQFYIDEYNSPIILENELIDLIKIINQQPKNII